MLDVYIDRKMAHTFVNSHSRIKIEKNPGQKNRFTRAETFVRQACNLILDKSILDFNKQLIPFFLQGVGSHGKVTFSELSQKSITEKMWAVALLDNENPLVPKVSKSRLTIHKTNLFEELSRLMFISPEQTTALQIKPSGSSNINSNANLKLFEGWDTFEKYPLVPLTDAIISDPYFLQPEVFKDSYNEYDIRDYIEKSILPLIKLLSKYTMGDTLTLNIFTEKPRSGSYDEIFASDLYDHLNQSIVNNELNIRLLLIVTKQLGLKKRSIHTNYFSLKTELSFYHFQSKKIEGSKKSDIAINPFATDNLNTDYHAIMQDDLAGLYQLLQKDNTFIYGNNGNLSKMIHQAFNKTNQHIK